MSDREAFEKWAADKDFIISTPVGRISLKAAACEVWQAAQAQVGSVSKNQISEVIFGWGLRNDDGYNLSLDDTDDIAEDILKQAAQAQAVCPHIVSGGEGTSWCRLAAKPQVNQQLLEALQKAESHLHAMMAHIDHKPRRFQEHCWQQVLDIRAAIAAAQEQV